jgi:hypothetical protein
VNLSSCSVGQATDTVTTPACTFPSIRRAHNAAAAQPELHPDDTASGNGTWTLSGSPVQFTVGPNPILMSTGDQNVTITTQSNVSSVNLANVIYVTSTMNLPGSSCMAGTNIPNGSGAGSASSTISASPAGCSAMTTAYSNVGGTNTTNQTWIIVPPQVILQMMYGEAHGIAAAYGPSDPTEEAVAITARNRLADSQYFLRALPTRTRSHRANSTESIRR